MCWLFVFCFCVRVFLSCAWFGCWMLLLCFDSCLLFFFVVRCVWCVACCPLSVVVCGCVFGCRRLLFVGVRGSLCVVVRCVWLVVVCRMVCVVVCFVGVGVVRNLVWFVVCCWL